MTFFEIAGHVVGSIGVLLTFVSYQMHDKRKLIFIQTLATLRMSLQYILIGALSGCFLNIVCIVRNVFFYNRDGGKKFFSYGFYPILFAVLIAIVSLFSWEGAHTLFLTSALAANTVIMGYSSPQTLRKSVLVTCSMIIVYNVIEHSYSGIVNESVSIVSALIGIVLYLKSKNKTESK